MSRFALSSTMNALSFLVIVLCSLNVQSSPNLPESVNANRGILSRDNSNILTLDVNPERTSNIPPDQQQGAQLRNPIISGDLVSKDNGSKSSNMEKMRFKRSVNNRDENDMTLSLEEFEEIMKTQDIAKVLGRLKTGYLRKVGFTENVVVRHNFEYIYVRNKASWHIAEERCQIWAGHLVSIHNLRENGIVHELHRSNYQIIWIGLTDYVQEDHFQWSDFSTANFANWNVQNGQPDDNAEDGSGEACVTQEFGGLWWDKPCEHEYTYVCKRNIRPRMRF